MGHSSHCYCFSGAQGSGKIQHCHYLYTKITTFSYLAKGNRKTTKFYRILRPKDPKGRCGKQRQRMNEHWQQNGWRSSHVSSLSKHVKGPQNWLRGDNPVSSQSREIPTMHSTLNREKTINLIFRITLGQQGPL